MRKTCPKNNLHNMGINPGDEFCYLCGAKLTVYDQQCQCGHDLSEHDKFCPNCGRPQQ